MSLAGIPSNVEQVCDLLFFGARVRAPASISARVTGRALGRERGGQNSEVARNLWLGRGGWHVPIPTERPTPTGPPGRSRAGWGAGAAHTDWRRWRHSGARKGWAGRARDHDVHHHLTTVNGSGKPTAARWPMVAAGRRYCWSDG